MKKVILSAVMVLALVGGSAFAASTQNKNAAGKTKPAATGTMKSGGKKHHKKRHHKTSKTSKTKNKNM
jgi:hypothetical protein